MNAPVETKVSNVEVGSLTVAANPSKGRGAKSLTSPLFIRQGFAVAWYVWWHTTDLPIDKRHSGQTTGVVIIGSNEHDDLSQGMVAQRIMGFHPDAHSGSA